MESPEELFQEVMLDHYRRPRNTGSLPAPPAGYGKAINPACGDEIEVWVNPTSEDRGLEMKFLGQGCAISQASASLMTVKLNGQSLAEIARKIQAFRSLLKGESDGEGLGDLGLFVHVRKFSARVACALVAWQALESALSVDNPPPQA